MIAIPVTIALLLAIFLLNGADGKWASGASVIGGLVVGGMAAVVAYFYGFGKTEQ